MRNRFFNTGAKVGFSVGTLAGWYVAFLAGSENLKCGDNGTNHKALSLYLACSVYVGVISVGIMLGHAAGRMCSNRNAVHPEVGVVEGGDDDSSIAMPV